MFGLKTRVIEERAIMANDEWCTPPEVFNKLDDEFNFIADVACTSGNNLCADRSTGVAFTSFYIDSLIIDWYGAIESLTGAARKRFVWCNPPYSNPMPWVQKAAEAQSKGLGTVMLLNADTSVGWFAEAYRTVSEIRYILADEKPGGGYRSGRLAFVNDGGEAIPGNNKPQLIFVFDPNRIATREITHIGKSELMGGAQ